MPVPVRSRVRPLSRSRTIQYLPPLGDAAAWCRRHRPSTVQSPKGHALQHADVPPRPISSPSGGSSVMLPPPPRHLPQPQQSRVAEAPDCRLDGGNAVFLTDVFRPAKAQAVAAPKVTDKSRRSSRADSRDSSRTQPPTNPPAPPITRPPQPPSGPPARPSVRGPQPSDGASPPLVSLRDPGVRTRSKSVENLLPSSKLPRQQSRSNPALAKLSAAAEPPPSKAAEPPPSKNPALRKPSEAPSSKTDQGKRASSLRKVREVSVDTLMCAPLRNKSCTTREVDARRARGMLTLHQVRPSRELRPCELAQKRAHAASSNASTSVASATDYTCARRTLVAAPLAHSAACAFALAPLVHPSTRAHAHRNIWRESTRENLRQASLYSGC